jgi:putative transposase
MAWKIADRAKLTWLFVRAVLVKRQSFAGVCRHFGISRRCGYRWWQRFKIGGRPALIRRAQRPHTAERLQQAWRERLFTLRRRHPTWGAQKLLWLLRRDYGKGPWPAVRTVTRWLTLAGFGHRRVRRTRPGPQVPPPPPVLPRTANDVWTIDFKGTFRTGDGTRMFTLTVRDLATRCVLAVRHLPRPTEAAVRTCLRALFVRHGLPCAIWVDNGPPFGGDGALGLSRLSVWWLRLGIQVDFSRPGCPQDNPGHEQMHRILKNETARPPAPTAAAQQQRFNRWRRRYNQHRPHASLGDRTPASLYRPSERSGRDSIQNWKYPSHWARLLPDARGRCMWQGRQRLLGRAFADEQLGVRLRDANYSEVYLGPHLLGTLHRRDLAGLRPAQFIRTARPRP